MGEIKEKMFCAHTQLMLIVRETSATGTERAGDDLPICGFHEH